eukprot:TRINITY_DN4186_c0_g3_i1.p1 TRINITY_DN4186_c0_g3~~TRINITY_DN4186_c0_g3_i1.p1  ORF type:complete len:783 (+),score=161.07 TRINITY_DN4186_c0_g3_i1:86-2434(+)
MSAYKAGASVVAVVLAAFCAQEASAGIVDEAVTTLFRYYSSDEATPKKRREEPEMLKTSNYAGNQAELSEVESAMGRARQSLLKLGAEHVSGPPPSPLRMMEVAQERASLVAKAVNSRQTALPWRPEPKPISAGSARSDDLRQAMSSAETALAAISAAQQEEASAKAAEFDRVLLKDSPLRQAQGLMNRIGGYLRGPTAPPVPKSRCTENCEKVPSGPGASGLLDSVPPLEPGKCIDDCNGRGSCSMGTCKCTDGWGGDACDMKTCPEDCNGRGSCVEGTCACDTAFYGPACENARCPKDCSQNGYCESGKCVCYFGWKGQSCDKHTTADPPRATASTLVNRAPMPARSHIGSAMKEAKRLAPPSCPLDCSKRGMCELDGTCTCSDGYSGLGCENHCPAGCSGRGECTGGMCVCEYGWSGPDCSVPLCCNGHGKCPIPGVCKCYKGWTGGQCELEEVCPDPDCSGHGTCFLGSCNCAFGWTGGACQLMVPPVLAPGAGAAAGGMLMPGAMAGGMMQPVMQRPPLGATALAATAAEAEAAGAAPAAAAAASAATDGVSLLISGEDPKKADAPSCNAPHGRWSDEFDSCVCTSPYHGERCEEKHCPDYESSEDGTECSGRGVCQQGKCFCLPGFGKANGSSGENICADSVCKADCGEHGSCKDGECACKKGWKGDTCREPDCGEDDCNGNGQCLFPAIGRPGRCKCDEGYAPPFCAEKLALLQSSPGAVDDHAQSKTPAIVNLGEATHAVEVEGTPTVIHHRRHAEILLQRHHRHREISAVRLS